MTLDLGTVATPEEALAAFKEAFAGFFRAGGTLTWGEWCSMDATSRDMAVVAGEEVTRDRAITFVNELVDRLNESDTQARADSLLDEIAGKL